MCAERSSARRKNGNLVKNKAYAIKTAEIVKIFTHNIRKGL